MIDNTTEALGKNGQSKRSHRTAQDAGKITVSRLRNLIATQDYKCALTGRDLAPEVAAVDHKIPLSRGGTNTIDNVQVVHAEVNSAKGTMTVKQFIALCREVVSYADNSDQRQE